MYRYLTALGGLAVWGLALGGCATNQPTRTEVLTNDAQAALQRMQSEDPNLHNVLSNAYGYAIFPSVSQSGPVPGETYGRGLVYQQGQLVGYANVSQPVAEAQLHGGTYAQLLVFQDVAAMSRFQADQINFTRFAPASAVQASATASPNFERGIAVITTPNGNSPVPASTEGQDFRYRAFLRPFDSMTGG